MKTFRLDTPKRRGYKGALFAAGLSFFLASAAGAKETLFKGVVLPAGSQQVGENRFKSSLKGYTETVEFYSKAYKGSPRKTIINQPGIRAVHIVNDGKGEWEGLNVYELDQEVRIFIVPRDPPAPTPKASGPASAKGPKGER